MADFSPDASLTLQERIKKADYLTRELSEHLRQASIPRLTALRNACKTNDEHQVSDQKVFDRTIAVLEAEEFARNLHETLEGHLKVIAEQTRELAYPGSSR